MNREDYFKKYRDNVIGIDQEFDTPFGKKKIVYADWTASGRMYGPIEDLLRDEIAPFVGNTHSESTVTGCSMTLAYREAKETIKRHVNASEKDILISSNSGMTGVVNKLQRILGLRLHESYMENLEIEESKRPIVFVSHMEHHSNQTSWLETICDVEIIQACPDGKVDLDHLKILLDLYSQRERKIAAVTSCSNVTGIMTPYYEISKLMHQHGGLCFVDFACSAPYISIDMHPEDEEAKLDAIYFSPHKFLGGPASSGILIFCQSLYTNKIPDNPGGGTVDWTNPWGEHKYHDEIEAREDGGTPAFLQTIRAALCVNLKEEMSPEMMLAREEEIISNIWDRLKAIDNLHVMADHIKERLCVISFYVDDLHYNLAVKLLNDRFGIQVRGGCSCAGTYGHYLLEVSREKSKAITESISCGILSEKPGWIRMSFHPVSSDDEVHFVLDALEDLAQNHKSWASDYRYFESKNEWVHSNGDTRSMDMVNEWFDLSLV